MPKFTIEYLASRPHPTLPTTRQMYDVVVETIEARSAEDALRSYQRHAPTETTLHFENGVPELDDVDTGVTYRAWAVQPTAA
jgi:ketopantoate reductase